jgi:hypothetical protein
MTSGRQEESVKQVDVRSLRVTTFVNLFYNPVLQKYDAQNNSVRAGVFGKIKWNQ